jgi:RHH-type proline utilization regulon transcriptional repressor/proline dehydrogenase/delta 1-pyrroline-5-carboxylate dehydrogenase
VRLLGSHFVLGETIGDALARAGHRREFLYSFDMLGEGARTADDAARYFAAYADAIDAIGASAGREALPKRPGISVKLSALHPRYEALSRGRVLAELPPRLLSLAQRAKRHDLNLTVDAEEADRLELSLDVFAATLAEPALAGWHGFGIAVQAYQKRASEAIDWLADAAKALDRRLMVRLVKGAYWDTEIKRAQERGLAGYPVFTRKAMTDLSYAACVRKLLAARPRLYPQFATHNALTVASVIEDAGWSGVSWRTAPIRPSCRWLPIRTCQSRPSCAGRRTGSAIPPARGIRIFRCRAICFSRCAAMRRGSNSATARRWPLCWPRSATRPRVSMPRP